MALSAYTQSELVAWARMADDSKWAAGAQWTVEIIGDPSKSSTCGEPVTGRIKQQKE